MREEDKVLLDPLTLRLRLQILVHHHLLLLRRKDQDYSAELVLNSREVLAKQQEQYPEVLET